MLLGPSSQWSKVDKIYVDENECAAEVMLWEKRVLNCVQNGYCIVIWVFN